MKPHREDTIRWGILGCSRVFRRHWGPALQTVDDAIIAGIASRSQEKARTWADESQIPRAYGDYDELLRDEKIDAVFIGLPNSLHCEWVIRSLEAGKHVLCDKPLGINANEARQMADAAEKNQHLLMEGFMYQYHTQYEKIRQWLSEDRIGPIKMIRVGFSFLYDAPENFRNDPALGGGALLDLGCYCVHIARLLLQTEPKHVVAQSVQNDQGADWTTMAILHFDPDVQVVIDCSFGCEGDRFLHIAGTQKMITSDNPVVSDPQVTLTLKSHDETITEVIPAQNCYVKMIRDFQLRLAENRILPSPARDAVANLRVLDAVRQADQSGRIIEI